VNVSKDTSYEFYMPSSSPYKKTTSSKREREKIASWAVDEVGRQEISIFHKDSLLSSNIIVSKLVRKDEIRYVAVQLFQIGPTK
jgi:hypothetical protein